MSEARLALPDVSEPDVDAVLEACRALVAVSAQSIAAVEGVVDVTQFRLLVVVGSRGAVSLRALAAAAAIHMSKASRMCDRMVTEGLLNRADDPTDRRHLALTLTPKSRRVLRKVMSTRRQAVPCQDGTGGSDPTGNVAHRLRRRGRRAARDRRVGPGLDDVTGNPSLGGGTCE